MARTLNDIVAAAATLVPTIVRDGVGLAGLGAITYGAHLVYVPAGYIVGGTFAVIAVALLTHLDQKAPS